jgi:DNA-binding CsgD family transcriptional regulator
VIPKAEGGTDTPKNILTTCGECHGERHEVIRPKNLRELQKKGRENAKHLPYKPKKPKRYEITIDEISFCMYGTHREICDYLMITRPTFHKILKNIKTKKDIEERAWELRRKYPRNQKQICDELGISRPTLYKILNGIRKKRKEEKISISIII